MVLPDGTGSDSGRPGKGRVGIFIGAVTAFVVGFVSLGTLSSPDTAGVEETTTTITIGEVEPPVDSDDFTVDQIARGDPFEWKEVIFLEDAHPIALFDHEGSIYLFATTRPSFDGFDEGGLRGWRTAEGGSWQPLGQMIPDDHVITHVSSTEQGIVALEWRGDGAEFAVWRSDDGIDWSVEEVSTAGLDPSFGVAPTAAGGSEALLVVTGRQGVNINARLREELRSREGADFDVPGASWGVEVAGDEVRFAFYGPFRFPLAEITAEDLDLDPDEVQAIVDNHQGRNPTTPVWSKSEDAGWQQSEILGAFSIEAITTTQDGDVVALGHGRSGFTTWSSSDGVNWEATEAPQGPSRIDQWQGRLVGPSDTGGIAVVVAGDQGSWEEMGPGEHFPNDLDWTINATGAGAGGVAVMITGWDGNVGAATDDRPELTRDEATLTLNQSSGSYSLEIPDGSTHTWSMDGSSAPEGFVVDLANGAIDFHHPDTGEFLASFPIEDIARTLDSYRRGQSISASHLAFAFTSDGSEWTIQDLLETCPHLGWCRVFGGDILVSHLEVTGSHVVAVAISNTGPYNPDLAPGFVVWSAQIP